MPQSIVQVDAFTNQPFKGNPAAICIMEEPADETWMQQVALEMNLSETAYLYPEDDAYHLRWFTPGAEVELCGHATVAAAHVLWQDGHVAKDAESRFNTRSGLLTARLKDDLISVSFPRESVEPFHDIEGIADALGTEGISWAKNRLGYIVVEVESQAALCEVAPDFSTLKALPHHGYCVTAIADDPDIDFVSRFFAPRLGVDEDPVTGSAHCVLGPWWAEKLGKTSLRAYQASERGGDLHVEIGKGTVTLSGQAVTTMRGELLH